MPRSPSPPAPCCSSGETLERGRHRGGWVQIRIPEERAEQAKRLARLIGREPFQKRSWAELGFFLASSALAYGRRSPWGRGDRRTGAHGRVRRRLDPRRRPAGRPGLGRWQRALARRMLGEEIAEPEPFTARPGFFGWLRASPRRPGRLAGGGLLRGQGAAHRLRRVVRPQHLGRGALRDRFASDRCRDGEVRPFGRLFGPGYNGGLGTRVRHPRRCVRDRGRVPVRRPVDDEAGRLPRPADDAPPARSRRRGIPGEKPRGVEVEDPRRGHRDPPAHRAQPARRHPGPAGRPGDAARSGQGQAREPRPGEDETADLDAIRRLVDEAHRGAKEAITDLRDLARGIHPPALDTGLENALATLAARSRYPPR
jgi:hypothetical protein